MFRKMRRHTQQLSEEETLQLVERNTAGVLALQGDDDYPYAVPLSYAYEGGHFYFHSAVTGHKIDAIARSPKCTFTIIDTDDVIPEAFTTAFRSVIAFGQVRVVEQEAEKVRGLQALGSKYSADYKNKEEAEISGSLGRVAVLDMQVEHMTGKEGIELTRARK